MQDLSYQLSFQGPVWLHPGIASIRRNELVIQQEPLLRAESRALRSTNVNLARAQASYLEKPEDRLIHLVEEHSTLYEKEWFSGLRFFKSRKPKDRLGSHKRSTGACKARLCHWAECSMEVRSPFLLDIFCGWCWLFYSIEQPFEYNANNWNIYATIYLNTKGGCK